MAEHDFDREELGEGEGLDPSAPQEQSVPFDEEAAWAAIVAGYGDEPPDPPGAKPFKSVEDLALLEPETNGTDDHDGAAKPPEKAGRTGRPAEPGEPGEPVNTDNPTAPGDPSGPEEPEPARVLGGSVAFAPGIGPGAGPRDHSLAEPADGDLADGGPGDGSGADDEGHFVPPEPPPLPEGDVTAKFAWLGVLGGPLLLLLAVLLRWEMTWWLTTVCVGGFLGGFVTLVTRMRTDDDEDDDPGRGAVV